MPEGAPKAGDEAGGTGVHPPLLSVHPAQGLRQDTPPRHTQRHQQRSGNTCYQGAVATGKEAERKGAGAGGVEPAALPLLQKGDDGQPPGAAQERAAAGHGDRQTVQGIRGL